MVKLRYSTTLNNNIITWHIETSNQSQTYLLVQCKGCWVKICPKASMNTYFKERVFHRGFLDALYKSGCSDCDFVVHMKSWHIFPHHLVVNKWKYRVSFFFFTYSPPPQANGISFFFSCGNNNMTKFSSFMWSKNLNLFL